MAGFPLGQAPQHPPYVPLPPEPRRRKKWPWLVAAVAGSVVLTTGAVVTVVVTSGDDRPTEITRLGNVSGMLKSATLSKYAAQARCIEGTSFQVDVLHRQGGCTGYGVTPDGTAG
ncbi:hypothetical protein [Actinoallomurus sp. NPDC050550]|uniref:hypothetical protein n=1 Tax=Actinoallomurus sp. NPDC050550 TaxID=3154937 RepID=UPI0033FDC44E